MARRGYEPEAVRAHVLALSSELDVLRAEVARLQAELQVARTPKIDESIVAQFLGEESARVLTQARDTAAELTARAERNALRIHREADQAAGRLRQETAATCDEELDDARATAAAIIESASAHRQGVLADLDRRRDVAADQLAGLMRARDELVRALADVRDYADAVTADLGEFRFVQRPYVALDDETLSDDLDGIVEPGAVVGVERAPAS